MLDQTHHTMHLDIVHPSGAEEWLCPTCGRRFVLQWPPAYKKIILEPGDEQATHSGGKGGVSLDPPRIGDAAGQPPAAEVADEPVEQGGDVTAELRPWLRALERLSRDGRVDED